MRATALLSSLQLVEHANLGKTSNTFHNHLITRIHLSINCVFSLKLSTSLSTLSHSWKLGSSRSSPSITKIHKNLITMSQQSDPSQIKNTTDDTVKTRSKAKGSTVVIDAEPITTVLSTKSKKKSSKSKASDKKEKPTKVSESSPSLSNKSISSKSEKKKGELSVKKGLNMFDLYLNKNPFDTANVESHVDTSVKLATESNVESSSKVHSETEKSEVEKVVGEKPTLSVNPKSAETLETSRSVTVEPVVGQTSLAEKEEEIVSDNVTPAVGDKTVKEKDSIPDDVLEAGASEKLIDAAKDVEPSKTRQNSNDTAFTDSFGSSSDTEASTDEEITNDGGTPVIVADSEPEKEKEKEATGNNDATGSEKTGTEGKNMVDLDDIETDEDQQAKPVQKGVGRRLRSRTTKPVPVIETTPVVTKKTRDSTLKPVKYGPKKSWRKSVPLSEKKKNVLKRKSAPSSDSDFDAEKDASSIKPPTKKAMSARKAASVPAEIEDFPCDNVSFHLPSYAQRWGLICKRRLALERELGKDILECEEVVNLMIKTVRGLGSCYEKLVREFVVNIPAGCDNPLDREYQKVYVRGKCVEFSPAVINKALDNPDVTHPDFGVSNNVICKTITANQVKIWPRKAKVPAVKLTLKYAILNRIASVNWVPTTHSSDVATGLGKLIYMIGTGTKFNAGLYIFNQIVQHAKTSVTKQPIAFPTLLCDIIFSQHPSIRHEGESAKTRAEPLSIHQKLYSQQHAPDIVGSSTAATDAPMTRKEIIAMLEANCKELDEKKLQFERMIHALKLEEAAAADMDEQMADAVSEEEEAGSDKEEESDSSASASV
ncbi:uncharacterized protein LOC123886481 [Trifolium pratense]|uniref:uncharacterized protein LOC123886481 n=1 Tax=Trifolium pratense TaxID=57577 RepID=UPI001E697F78|nr:uncharacterized protein LOC123886481 [Trifolium pratense]